ncbi:MAG TPA: extracellular solute-binding protein [Leptolyngbyaceae cyanobacterium M65_K2018_010]|nr:extracellular solute-binding protein [Leptolyngbyaceae cyanobacterium M65_K2018_010]
MHRRTFLTSSLGISLAALGAGCQRTPTGDLTLALLAGSVPVQLIQTFQRQQADLGQVAIMAKDSLLQLYTLLQTWHTPAAAAAATPTAIAHWVTQADYWLAPIIQQGLIQPIQTDDLERWSQLPGVWPPLVRRDRQGWVEARGAVWGLPYRWTVLAMLYDTHRLDTPLQSWSDLLQPALTRRLMLPEHPRLVLGLALKALGASANSADPRAVKGLESFLASLQQQVRWYNSDHSLKALAAGDGAAVVGWLDALLPVMKRYRHLQVAIPPEGTLASADLWVQPSRAQAAQPLATDWLNFSLAADFTTQMAVYSQGLSPWLWDTPGNQWPAVLQDQAKLLTQPGLLERSEFLEPLPPTAQARYDQLWEQMRRSTLTG